MHLMSTVEFYKGKIAEMKAAHTDLDLFADKRKYAEVVDEQDGKEWKEFQSDLR